MEHSDHCIVQRCMQQGSLGCRVHETSEPSNVLVSLFITENF
jgi:hypothetical protein